VTPDPDGEAVPTKEGRSQERRDLSGTWRAAIADEELRRSYTADAFDDASWEPVEVPGHWSSTPAFAGCDGPLLYRRAFDALLPAKDRRSWLVLDGIFYQGDVWLDEAYVGATEGYFFHHTFEVTEALAARSEHALAIEVVCSPQEDQAAKRNLTGVFQHWDCHDRDLNPGGIWRPVRVEQTGPVRLRRPSMLCTDASESQAVVAVAVVVDTLEAGTFAIRTTVAPSGGGPELVSQQEDHPLAAGENQVEWTVTVPEPARWWPWSLGEQPLHDVTIEVLTEDGEVSHHVTKSLGLRTVELRNWIAHVNGERLFLKGSNQGPTRQALAEATAADLEGDVNLAREAGLDFLRIHAHISRPELYDAADRAGLLLWQDLPLQWGYARGVRKQAVRQARKAVELLGHHPSVAIWCGHNEPMAIDIEAEALADPVQVRRLALRSLAAQELPTWNRTILDRSIKRALRKADPSRPVIANSGMLPHLPQLDGTDTHTYFGWYFGDERDFPTFLRRIPRLARFVTEFGAQAVPADAAFCDPEQWPDLDWSRLGRTHNLQKAQFDRYVPPADFATFDEWREATQRYQAEVIKHHVEALRKLKYRPTGGFAQFCFADGHPAVTWSVLGHDRAPKAGFDALVEACRPVIVTCERPPATVHAGERLALPIHAVSDLHRLIRGARVSATVRWAGGEESWAWQGDLSADECTRIGAIDLEVPDAPGPLAIDLELVGDGLDRVANHYATEIADDGPIA
jgi:beta-mannosidase